VRYLRSLDDSKAIRQRAQNVKRAAVIGGGFIGMEVAAVLAQKGVEITMILREERIWKQFFSPRMSSFFEAYYTARGVHQNGDGQGAARRRNGKLGGSRGRAVDPERDGRRGHRRPPRRRPARQ
jgi:NADPH-dependent 2,4-dienoyl-CoA reductase/sulfur reductase-like enzyme